MLFLYLYNISILLHLIMKTLIFFTFYLSYVIQIMFFSQYIESMNYFSLNSVFHLECMVFQIFVQENSYNSKTNCYNYNCYILCFPPLALFVASGNTIGIGRVIIETFSPTIFLLTTLHPKALKNVWSLKVNNKTNHFGVFYFDYFANTLWLLYMDNYF